MNNTKFFMMKKAWLLILPLVLVFLTVSHTMLLSAADNTCGASATFQVSDSGQLSISGSGSINDYAPGDIPWKDFASSITSLSLSEGITRIGTNAFLNLNLVVVEIPGSVIDIGEHALGYTYNQETGEYTPISGFTITGEAGSAAERYASDPNNNFTFVPLEKEFITGKCGSDLTWKLSSDGVLTVSGNGAMYDFDSAKSVPWAKYAVKTDGYQITSAVISSGVTTLGSYAFADCRALASVSLPDGLTEISPHAFANCSSLASVTIPGSVSVIGNEAFSACTALADLTVSSGVTAIGDSAFTLTAISKLSLPSSVTTVGNLAFYGCEALTDVSLPGVTTISSKAFAKCSALSSISTGSALTSIGSSAFEGCSSLSSFRFPASLTSIGERAFYSCQALASLSLPDSLLHLGEYAFYQCSSLRTVSIGNNLQIINEGAFEGCELLSSVNFGSSVNSICERAFTNCSKLRSITLPKSVRYIAQNAIGYYYFEDPDNNISGAYTKYTDFVPEILAYTPSAAEEYAKDNAFTFTSLGLISADGGDLTETAKWTINTATGVLMINGSGKVPDYVSFESTPWALYASYIETVIYGSGIENVGSSSFEECASLTSLTLANTVTEIGDLAFADTGLVTVTLPKSLTTIHDGAFDGCTSLSSVSLPENLTYIGQYAFRGPNSLKSMYIPESVGFIGSFAIGYNQDNTLTNNFNIKGIKNSTAHNYADENSISFREDGFIEVSDPNSGCKVDILGSEGSKFTLNFSQIAATLEPEVFLAGNEYALVYNLSLFNNEVPVTIEGTALITFPIPENINPIAVRIYALDETGAFTELEFQAEDGYFVFSHGSLGKFVISNADLTVLYTITVSYQSKDGTEMLPSQSFRGTANAEYNIPSAELEGFSPDQNRLTGKLTGTDLALSFLYTDASVSTQDSDTLETGDSTTDVGGSSSAAKTVLIIVEVILILGLIAAIVALILLTKKKKKDENEKAKIAATASKAAIADKFADTIVVPDAKTQEIDIQSLFADEPEEDLDAVNELKRNNKND